MQDSKANNLYLDATDALNTLKGYLAGMAEGKGNPVALNAYAAAAADVLDVSASLQRSLDILVNVVIPLAPKYTVSILGGNVVVRFRDDEGVAKTRTVTSQGELRDFLAAQAAKYEVDLMDLNVTLSSTMGDPVEYTLDADAIALATKLNADGWL